MSLTYYNCSGSIYSQTVTTALGYFPLQLSGNGNENVTAENVEPLHRCYLDEACPPSSVDNKNSATSAKYNCKNGYENRLCSRCISGWFRDGYECSPCQWYHKALLSWVWAVTAIAFVLWIWVSVPSSDSAALKVNREFKSLFSNEFVLCALDSFILRANFGTSSQ